MGKPEICSMCRQGFHEVCTSERRCECTHFIRDAGKANRELESIQDAVRPLTVGRNPTAQELQQRRAPTKPLR